jgi:hypothetical protein
MSFHLKYLNFGCIVGRSLLSPFSAAGYCMGYSKENWRTSSYALAWQQIAGESYGHCHETYSVRG